MAPEREDLIYRPDLAARKKYEKLYRIYRNLTECEGAAASAMRELRELCS